MHSRLSQKTLHDEVDEVALSVSKGSEKSIPTLTKLQELLNTATQHRITIASNSVVVVTCLITKLLDTELLISPRENH